MNDKKNVALIPARKGSKRFPGKNRALMNGKSLVEHAIICALETGIFSNIILSTDDEHFYELSQKYQGLTIRKRPECISGEYSTPYEVLMDVHEEYFIGQPIRYCYLQPTSPLRQSRDLIDSISDNSISVYYDEYNKLENSHNVLEFLKKMEIHPYEQDKKNSFKHMYFNGLFYWIDVNILIKQRGLVGSDTSFIETPMQRSFDIDYKTDLEAMLLHSDIFSSDE